MRKTKPVQPESLSAEEARIIRGVQTAKEGILLLTDMTDLVGGSRKDPRWHGPAAELVKRKLLKRDAVLGAFPMWYVTKKGKASLAAFDETACAPPVPPRCPSCFRASLNGEWSHWNGCSLAMVAVL